jgi:hypothetical protein
MIASMLPLITCFIFFFTVKKNTLQAGTKKFVHKLINNRDEMREDTRWQNKIYISITFFPSLLH